MQLYLHEPQHAQRHITHDESLKGITILSSRAGRPRVRQNPDSRPSLQQPPESAVQHHDGESLRALDNVDDESRPLYSDLLLERNALQSRVLLLEELLVSNSITIPEKHPSPGPTLQPVQQLIRFANRLHSQCEELDTRSTSFQNMHERHDKSINAILTFLAVFYERSLESQEDQPD